MDITRFLAAERYAAPKHQDMVAFRLQGQGVTHARGAWVGLSYFLPGGGAEHDVSAVEKIYFVVEGKITLEFDGSRHVLEKFDSCVIAAGEGRTLRNETQELVKMLVIVPSGATA